MQERIVQFSSDLIHQLLVHQSLRHFRPSSVIPVSPEWLHTPYRPDVIHRVVTYQRAKGRAGTAKTKTRAEVSGSGRKPWPQKGQGRARAGSLRSPIFRGGGVAHGPTNERIWEQQLPKKVRWLGLASALSRRISEGRLWVVERWWRNDTEDAPLTARELEEMMRRRDWTSVLLVCQSKASMKEGVVGGEGLVANGSRRDSTLSAEWDWPEDVKGLQRAAQNVSMNLTVKHARLVSVYDLVRYQNIVLSRTAMLELVARIRPGRLDSGGNSSSTSGPGDDAADPDNSVL